ncbi:MAG: hypothetical protein Q9227_007009 [Pyrenula ochraceoflavens]
MATGSDLTYIFHHVFLPPKLPQQDDTDVDRELALIHFAEDSLKEFERIFQPNVPKALTRARTMLSRLYCHMNGDVSGKLSKLLSEMEIDDVASIYVRNQNAGLLIHRKLQSFVFMAYELSAAATNVMSVGRLRRIFPGPAVEVASSRVRDNLFLFELERTLDKLVVETPHDAVIKTVKASHQVPEERDAILPIYVTELIMAILQANGNVATVHHCHKRVRDDVQWDDTKLPWRRSPLWLLVRVSLQWVLGRLADNEGHFYTYKAFMSFFMSRILLRSTVLEAPSETIFLMSAKVVRRLIKLDPPEKTLWLGAVQASVNAAHHLLNERWSSQQQSPCLGIAENKSLLPEAFQQGLQLRASSLRNYLKNRPVLRSASPRSQTFDPLPYRRIHLTAKALPAYEPHHSIHHIWLVDLESWVADSLKDWVEITLNSHHQRVPLSNGVFSKLGSLATTYHSKASSVYANRPALFSVMILTMLEFWRAMDKLVQSDCSLISDYESGFLPKTLEPLILRTRSETERVRNIQTYILERSKRASHRGLSALNSFGQSSSFGVRFFNQSAHHQDLRKKIEGKAHSCRQSKEAELSQKLQRYQQLIESANAIDCNFVTRFENQDSWKEHVTSCCTRCMHISEAKSIDIDPYEWPLPQKDLAAKGVVFELDVPAGIAEWRDLTILLIHLLSPETKTRSYEKTYTFQEANSLRDFVSTYGRRYQLQSTVKPFCRSHYKHPKVSTATKADVCQPHGARYEPIDSQRFCQPNESEADIRHSCMFVLPSGPYHPLQHALLDTTHSSNFAVSVSHSTKLDSHEAYSFASFRAGNRLQMFNLARELASPVLRFNRDETYLLISQALWQVGPAPTGDIGEAHHPLQDRSFGRQLMGALESALARHQESWQNCTALRIFATVARRLLSLTPHAEIKSYARQFLNELRDIMVRWMRDLAYSRHKSSSEALRRTRGLGTLDAALICYETFDVELCELEVLFSRPFNLTAAIECAIHIHDRSPVDKSQLPLPTQHLLEGWHRIAVAIEKPLRDAILTTPATIDSAIQSIWDGYRPAAWTYSNGWLVSQAVEEIAERDVHFDMLTGSLMINGDPLTRLPAEYEAHDTYRRLLGSTVIDVVPSRMPGMRFLASSYFGDSNSQLHFGLHDGELIICADSDSQIYELIPMHFFRDAFPDHFIEDFVHWLILGRGVVELRPFHIPWTPKQDGWSLSLESFTLRDGDSKLIDPLCPAATAIHTIFKPLEHCGRVNIIQSTDTITIELPRYRLDFNLVGSRIFSHQYPGMWIDEDPSIGTLIGLQSRLSLCDDRNKIVLVPFGTVHFQKTDAHVDVNICVDQEAHIYAYRVDRRLGRLCDDLNLQARLFRCYLHALTSSCLPDRLTGRTGTEECLNALRHSWARSFISLTDSEAHLLEQLASLSPRITFYPSHLRVMQQAHWKNLPSLSQHPEFFFAIQNITNRTQYLTIFSKIDISLPSRNEFLLKRFAARQASFRIEGFGAEYLPSEAIYSRDSSNSTRYGHAWAIARLALAWSPSLNVCSNLLSIVRNWGRVGFQSSTLPFGYHRDWLQSPQQSLAGRFLGLQQELIRMQQEHDLFRIAFWLATLAFAPDADIELCHVLLAFATVPALQVPLPQQPCNLDEGYEPRMADLKAIAQSHCRRLEECSEHTLSQKQDETRKQFEARKRRKYQANLDQNVRILSERLMLFWPDKRLPTTISFPQAKVAQYINVAPTLAAAQRKFDSWHNNETLRVHLEDMQGTISSLDVPEKMTPAVIDTDVSVSCPASCGYVRFTKLASEAPFLPSITDAHDTAALTHQNHFSISEMCNRLVPESEYEKDYIDSLKQSLAAAQRDSSSQSMTALANKRDHVSLPDTTGAEQHASILDKAHNSIATALSGSSPAQQLAVQIGLAPRLSPVAIFERLARDQRERLTDSWRAAFVQYARLLRAAQQADDGLASGSPASDPDWLLFELENNLTIRPIQKDIAYEMMRPSSGKNTTLQLDMGQGKTSVITPIVAASLANGSQLVRIVVLRPLATAMHHTLSTRIGGLLNRPIFYLPFNRSLRLSPDQADVVQATFERCKEEGGVLLAQPEHLLSFQLLILDHTLCQEQSAWALLNTRRWLLGHARDVLDESDELLNVRFELVYTVGHQKDVEFAPNRWTLIQSVLRAAALFAFESTDVITSSNRGQFPRLQFHNNTCVRSFFDGLLRYLCIEGLSGLSFGTMSSTQRRAVETYLGEENLDRNDPRLASLSPYFEDSCYRDSLLILRGLFAHGVLRFCLERRWRVHYGLDPSRTRLAVPYRGKDDPAPRAEFSHPEVIIVLTSLSYYHGGLSDSQLRDCFDTLSRQDDSEDIYSDWVRDAPGLPSTYHSLTGVNLQDDDRCTRLLFPKLRFASSIVDFFVSHHVFAQELRAFPSKLAASGWDLAEPRVNPTTGFSGTNDSREVLPATIQHADLPDQLHTNATVLSRLFAPTNTYISAGADSEVALLDAITDIRVLIDVGARVLEWTNRDLASNWLQRSDAEAAVFFDEDDQVCVLDRRGRIDLLILSPFNRRLDQCLVYLDQVHTRGVDLPLPDCAAAVTLSPDLTKDRLVQGSFLILLIHAA